MRKFNDYYIAEMVNSYLHMYRRDYHHDRIDVVPLAAGTSDVDDNPVALYLGYH
jgi:hypothetical protein